MEAFGAIGRPLSRSREDHQRPSSGYEQPDQQQRRLRFAEEVSYDERPQAERHRFGGRHQSKLLGFLKIRPKESGLKHDGEQERGRLSRESLMPEGRSLRMSSVPAMHDSPRLSNSFRNNSIAGLDEGEGMQNLQPYTNTSRKERMSRVSWEPPPLCSAYEQAVKHGPVTAPAGSVDAILKAHRLQSLAAPSESDIAEADLKKKRPSSPNPAEAFTTKIFVLTTTGYLLQYSGEGEHNRKPERIMQLNTGSAAMACDAVPGKHWVLRISETFNEDEPPSSARISRFALPKLGLGGKKGPENYLLIMDSPDELDAWLSTVKREIQTLSAVNHKIDQINTPSMEDEVEESINPRNGFAISPPPRVVIERTASQVRRKPVSGASPTESTASSQHIEDSPAKQTFMLNVDSDSEDNFKEQGGSAVPALTADHMVWPSQQRCYQGVSETPTLEANHVGNRPSSRESTTYSNQALTESTRPTTLRTAVVTGRRRSSGTQSPAHATFTASSGDHVDEDIMSRPRSSSQTLSPSYQTESPNRKYTGLRKKTSPITVSHNPSTDTYDRVSANSPIRPKTAPSFEAPLPPAPSEDRIQVPLSAGFRRLSPGSDLGPVVLTPPESPETVTHPQAVSLVSEINNDPASALSSGGTVQEQRSLTRQEEGEADQGTSEDEDSNGEEITTAQFMALNAMKTPNGMSSPHAEAAQMNTDMVPASQGSRTSGAVAVAMPLTAGRSVQVDVLEGTSFQRGPGRSFTLGLVGSLKPESRGYAREIGKAVGGEEGLSGNTGKKPLNDQAATGDRKDSNTSIMTIENSLSPSSSSKAPPLRYSSLYSSALIPKALAPARSVSQPVYSIPSSQPRKDSKVSLKTAQLRQKLVEIDASRLPQATNALLLAPSPHPAPTVALPALPPGAHPPRASTMPQIGAKENRIRASSLASQRNAMVTGDLSSRKLSEPSQRAATPEQRNRSPSSSSTLVSPPHIVETTRPRRPKVDRITLTPMSSVSGMAGRRRERSGSPGDLRSRSRSGSPHAMGTVTTSTRRHEKSSGLVREDILKSFDSTGRDIKSEMEQIEADLNALDEARERRAREVGSVFSNPDNGPRASTFEEILIGLGISPRTAPQFIDSEEPPTPPRKDTPKDISSSFPKRISSISYGQSLNVPEQNQRSRIAGSIEEEDIGDPNPLASNPITTPDLRGVEKAPKQPCLPPSQPLPALPAQPKAASMSAISAAAASITVSPSSEAAKSSPYSNTLASRLSPPMAQRLNENRQRSHSSPRMYGHKRQAARQERVELPGSEAESENTAVEVPASQLSPPVRMQASVTDLSQDDFFMWSIPAFSSKDPASASLPSSMDQTFSPSELQAQTPMTQASSDDSQPHGRKESSQISPKDNENYIPLGIPSLGMSLDGSAQQQGTTDGEGDRGKNLPPSRAKGSRWSLFGAIERIQ